MNSEEYERPSVVAVVVNFNAGAWLVPCVDSLRDSDCEMEIQVVDNASTDGSIPSLAASLQDAGPGSNPVEIVRNRENSGFARANNQVLGARHADYYVLVNPDCIVEPVTVGRLIQAMRGDPDIGLASCLIRNADGTVQATCKRSFPTPGSALVRILGLGTLLPGWFADFDRGDKGTDGAGVEYVDAVSGAFMVVRGSAMERVGHLDEGYFMHCEDLDWCKRFWLAGFKVAFVPDVGVTHAKGASGRSLRVNWHLHQGMLRFYRKFYMDQYPRFMYGLVYVGVWFSFLVKSIWILIRGQHAAAR